MKTTTATPATGTLYWYMTPGIVAESDLSGAIKSEYVFFDGERVARRDTNSGVFYYFSDHLKTASVETDASGNIKDESDFYPWGSELQFTNSNDNHYKFTGKERDAESQLDYFGARYYGSSIGRFLSPDWSSVPSAVPYANLEDPQTMNLYSYVGNDPLMHADSDGHAKDIQLSGKYTVRIDKNNLNDMPNLHIKQGGIEVARGRVNADKTIEWETYKGKILGLRSREKYIALQSAKAYFKQQRSVKNT
jgi:RHS repeat-associated protein